jgi:stress response protein YsnF
MPKRVPSSSGERARRPLSVTLPVVQEEAVVHRKRTRRPVRVVQQVEAADTTLIGEAVSREVVVERVPIDRFVEKVEGMRHEGDTLVIPVFEEVPVVVMKIRLKEEVRITMRTRSEERQLPVTVRRNRITIDRTEGGSPGPHHHQRKGEGP